MKRTPLVVALAASLALAACGSDPAPSPAEPPVTNEVPADATASPAAFVTWMGQQPQSETKEPLKIEGFVPPTSETDEPVPLS